MGTKKEKIKELAADMLKQSYQAMLKKIDIALNSGAIDIDNWDEKSSPMIIPKSIVCAILESEIHQYDGNRTGIEKQIKKQVRNIRYFL